MKFHIEFLIAALILLKITVSSSLYAKEKETRSLLQKKIKEKMLKDFLKPGKETEEYKVIIIS